MSIDWGIPKLNVSTVWSNATSATGIDDLEALYNDMKDNHGIILDKFTMNRNTFTQLQAQASTRLLSLLILQKVELLLSTQVHLH